MITDIERCLGFFVHKLANILNIERYQNSTGSHFGITFRVDSNGAYFYRD